MCYPTKHYEIYLALMNNKSALKGIINPNTNLQFVIVVTFVDYE